ncbi:MAG: STAS domain-containing protein [Candidatus Omnitrophota bacterium]|nr:STAS domain-containing protein [Candidatus Omnitrophota bacterium]
MKRADKTIENHIEIVESQQNVTIVRLCGNVTFANLMQVRDEFIRKTAGIKVKNILFDLKAVERTDSSGLAILINLFKHMKETGAGEKIGLINLSSKMKDLIEISKVQNLFKEYTSERRAINALK